MDVISITKIMESSMKWECKFQLNLTWVEGRVRWRDLSHKTNLNKISHVGPGQVYSRDCHEFVTISFRDISWPFLTSS